MTKKNQLQLFNDRKVRTVWDTDLEEWYFSVVDVVEVLTNSENPRRYLSDLKRKLKKEGSEVYEKIVQLKLPAADGKMRLTDVATTEQMFRLIQSIPSPKAEPFKQWMAQVAATRIDQMQDPELSIEQAVADYRNLGYSDEWINQRLRSIDNRDLKATQPHDIQPACKHGPQRRRCGQSRTRRAGTTTGTQRNLLRQSRRLSSGKGFSKRDRMTQRSSRGKPADHLLCEHHHTRECDVEIYG